MRSDDSEEISVPFDGIFVWIRTGGPFRKIIQDAFEVGFVEPLEIVLDLHSNHVENIGIEGPRSILIQILLQTNPDGNISFDSFVRCTDGIVI